MQGRKGDQEIGASFSLEGAKRAGILNSGEEKAEKDIIRE